MRRGAYERKRNRSLRVEGLRRYEEDGRFGYGSGKRIRLRMRIAKAAGQHLLESRLSEDQLVKERVDVYEIAATVVETERLKWWLRGFGGEVEVLAPKGLLRVDKP